MEAAGRSLRASDRFCDCDSLRCRGGPTLGGRHYAFRHPVFSEFRRHWNGPAQWRHGQHRGHRVFAGHRAVTFNTSATTWGSGTGQFANYASVTGLASGALTSAQTAATDRALGVRQTQTFGDPGAAFEFQFHNTLGFKDFTLSFQSEMASVQGRSTTWNVEWALDSLPTSFNLLGQITDPGTFGEATNSYSLPVAVNDQSLNVWIRVATLSTASGSNNRDTFSIDDFKLSYVTAVPEVGAFWLGAVICGTLGLACAGRTTRRGRWSPGRTPPSPPMRPRGPW
jgi:hypothetical protein